MVQKEKLDRVSSLASKLNNATDDLNATIAKIEERLKGIGLAVWVDLTLDERNTRAHADDGGDGYYVHTTIAWDLGYAKVGDAWRIAAKRCTGTATTRDGAIDDSVDREWSDDGEPVALVTAPRSVRVAAVKYLDDLLDKIAQQAERFIADVEAAKEFAAADSSTGNGAGDEAVQKSQVVIKSWGPNPQAVHAVIKSLTNMNELEMRDIIRQPTPFTLPGFLQSLGQQAAWAATLSTAGATVVFKPAK